MLYALRGHDDLPDRVVRIVVQIVDANGTTVAASVFQGAVVVEEIVFSFELNDGWAVCLAIAGDLVQGSFKFPGAFYRAAHGVSYFLRVTVAIGEIVPAIVLVQVGAFCEGRKVKGPDGAVRFQ